MYQSTSDTNILINKRLSNGSSALFMSYGKYIEPRRNAFSLPVILRIKRLNLLFLGNKETVCGKKARVIVVR